MAHCRLCLIDKPLAQSHIIPEFLYASLYNDDGRMMGITGQGEKGWKLIQKGLRENLLCRDCEALLNERYEIPFQQQWTHRYPLPVHANVGDVIEAQFDYGTFKLFHLSILFRASVATLATFGVVRLGKHEDILRRMILANDPGRPDQYPMIATAVINARNEIVRGVIAAPTLTRVEGHHVYGFGFDGVVWGYSVSSAINRTFVEVGLQPDGRMAFLVTPWHEYPMFQQAANALRNPQRRMPIG